MMLDGNFIIYFLLLGAVVGFMAGLLGIGGGGIMVPVLTSLFLALSVPIDNVVHLALGTSMAAIIFTSFASMRAHLNRGAVIWSYVKAMSPGILVGTFVATYVVAFASSLALAIFFSVFMAVVALRMLLNSPPKKHTKAATKKHLFAVGGGIGAISALVSIGGGSLTVPYLLWHNVDIKQAIGTSAAMGLPISVAGTLGYVINGWQYGQLDEYTVGFVYLPAVVLISLSSFLTAPLGAKTAHFLPVTTLRKIFAMVLIGLSIKMLMSII